MARPRKWTDEQLRDAVKGSTSWVGVSNALGVAVGGASKVAIVRRASELDLGVRHLSAFTPPPQRRQRDACDPGLTKDEVQDAAKAASTWTEFRDTLGFTGGSGYTACERLASHFDVSTSHFRARTDPRPIARSRSVQQDFGNEPSAQHLWRSAAATASAWFMHRGYVVSIPVEPAKYDLVVDSGTGFKRVQVKSTAYRDARGGRWSVGITRNEWRPSKNGAKGHWSAVAYSPGELDYFFILCADGSKYLIPAETVAGQRGIVVDSKYAEFRLD